MWSRQVTVWGCSRTEAAADSALCFSCSEQFPAVHPPPPRGVPISKFSDKMVYSFPQQIFTKHLL